MADVTADLARMRREIQSRLHVISAQPVRWRIQTGEEFSVTEGNGMFQRRSASQGGPERLFRGVFMDLAEH